MIKLTKKEAEMLWRYVKLKYNDAECRKKAVDGKLQKSYAKEAAAWKALVDKIEAETGYSGEPRVSSTYFEVRYKDELVAYARTFTEAKARAESHCRCKDDYFDVDILEYECGCCIAAKSMNDE